MLTTDYEVVSNGEKDTIVIRPSSPDSSTRKKQKAKQSKGVVVQFFDEKEFHDLKVLEKSILASFSDERFKKSKEDSIKQTYLRLMRIIESRRTQYHVKKKESISKFFDTFEGFGK